MIYTVAVVAALISLINALHDDHTSWLLISYQVHCSRPLASFSQVSRLHHDLVQDRVRDRARDCHRLARLLFNPTFANDLLADLDEVLSFPQPDRDLIIRDLFTELNTLSLLVRLDSVLETGLEKIIEVLRPIRDVAPVAELICGWAAILHSSYASWSDLNPEALQLVTTFCTGIVDVIAPDYGTISLDNVPDDLLNAIQARSQSNVANRIRARLPEPFRFLRSEDTAEIATMITAKFSNLLRSSPDLFRTLYGAGIQLNLGHFSWPDITSDQLRLVLPYTTGVADFIYQPDRYDLISQFIHWTEFQVSVNGDIMSALFDVAIRQGWHDLLRDLVAMPFGSDLFTDLEEVERRPLLHRAVQANDLDAVLILLSAPNLIDIEARDEDGRAARDYAEDGSQIALVIDQALVELGDE